MKTIYLHIGTAKTGTTVIQKFCANNRKVLEGKGFGFPTFPVKYNYVPKVRNGFFIRVEDLDKEKPVYKECMDVIADTFKDCQNVILSDEGLWRSGQKRHRQIFEALKKEGYQAKVIVYLRRQDEYLVSKWKQFVKWGYFAAAQRESDATAEKYSKEGGLWETFLQNSRTDVMMDYYANLKKLEKVYGRENIIVRRYDRKCFLGGSICADFLDALGLELTDEYLDADIQTNGSLTPNTAEFQRILNTMPGYEDYDTHMFFQNVLLSFSEISSKKYPCSMFSKDENKEFMEHYREGNNLIAKEYLGEDELFNIEWENARPKWEKDNPYVQDDLVRFIGAACVGLLEENRKTREEFQELKNYLGRFRHPIKATVKRIKKHKNGDKEITE